MSMGHRASKRCQTLIGQVAANYGGEQTLEFFKANDKARELWKGLIERDGLKEAEASFRAWSQVAHESKEWALEHGKAPVLASDVKDRFHVSKIDVDQMDIERDCRWVLAALGAKGNIDEIEAACPSTSALTLFKQGRDKDCRKDVIQWCLKYIRPMPNKEGQSPEEEGEEAGLASLLGGK